MKRFAAIVILSLALTAHANNMPYNGAVDANRELQQAFVESHQTKQPILLIFGANWCEDCRALDEALKTEKNAALMAKKFKVVKIDVGNFDHNLDISARYGNPIQKGIPAAVILSPENKILYTTHAGELANARRMSANGVYDFFSNLLKKTSSINMSK
ncbi:MAG: thioredoxin family protein [Pseudomonadota bacterium]